MIVSIMFLDVSWFLRQLLEGIMNKSSLKRKNFYMPTRYDKEFKQNIINLYMVDCKINRMKLEQKLFFKLLKLIRPSLLLHV